MSKLEDEIERIHETAEHPGFTAAEVRDMALSNLRSRRKVTETGEMSKLNEFSDVKIKNMALDRLAAQEAMVEVFADNPDKMEEKENTVETEAKPTPREEMVNPELRAMDVCLNALRPLPHDAIVRALRWLGEMVKQREPARVFKEPPRPSKLAGGVPRAPAAIQPRVWVGNEEDCPRVYCMHEASAREGIVWGFYDSIDRFDIFVPHAAGKPTVDPSEWKTLETCSEIDWCDEGEMD